MIFLVTVVHDDATGPGAGQRAPRAIAVEGGASGADDRVALGYEARLVRRKRLQSTGGLEFVIDLPELVSLEEGDTLVLDNGLRIAVEAAPERLLRIEGDLVRLAWHIGNRHTPCQIASDHLLIAHDHVLADMISKLGGRLTEVMQPFRPQGGAYGHGRTFGHSHDGELPANSHR